MPSASLLPTQQVTMHLNGDGGGGGCSSSSTKITLLFARSAYTQFVGCESDQNWSILNFASWAYDASLALSSLPREIHKGGSILQVTRLLFFFPAVLRSVQENISLLQRSETINHNHDS